MHSPARKKRRALVAILMARPGSEGREAALLQILLVLASPVVLTGLMYSIAKLIEPITRQFWGNWNYRRFSSYESTYQPQLPPLTEDGVLMLLVIGSMTGLFLCVSYLFYRFGSPAAGRTNLRFVRHCWMTALVNLVAGLTVFYVILLLPPAIQPMQWPSPLDDISTLLPITLLLLGPTLLARLEHRGIKKPSWRPQCPECGHSLKHARARCSECGEAFPTERTRFRRWAVLRLPWDRARRGFLLVPYWATLAGVVFMPRRFAGGAAVPDRIGRAWRWAAFHMLLVAGVAALGKYGPRWYFEVVLPYSDPLGPPYEGPDLGHYAVWASQTAAMWLAAQVSYFASAVILLNLLPGTLPAARRTMLKWALYCTAALPVLEVAVLGIEVTGAIPGVTVAGRFAWMPGWQRLWWDWQQLTRPPELLIAMGYGWLWAAGVSANRWIAWRGCTTWMVTYAAYVGIWLCLTQLLFRIGAIEALF